MKEKGYVQLYTGNGRGKTTAAFGLAVRALCAGKRVFIGQFVKDMKYNETQIETLFADRLTIRQFGQGCFFHRLPEESDTALAHEGLRLCREALASGVWDVVVMDEVTIATSFGLLTDEEVLEALAQRAPSTEVILTGRYASEALIARADLVTEMKEIKHYYTKGILSRDGYDH